MSMNEAADKLENEWYLNMKPCHHPRKESGMNGDLAMLIELLGTLEPYEEEELWTAP